MDLFCAAVSAVSADHVMPAMLPAPRHGKLLVIAAGKAAAAMMQVARQRTDRRFDGLVVTRHGHVPEGMVFDDRIEVIQAGHPVPDESSALAAHRALTLVGALRPEDHFLFLVSGGGSALLAAPVDGVSLADKQLVTKALLQSGATIAEINCVRKHLSRIKGGRLAVAAGPARVTTWAVSDVPGDDLSFVASGPTLYDPTTLSMAKEILRTYHIEVPRSVMNALDTPDNETPAADSPGLAGAESRILARAADALAAAGGLAAQSGYDVINLGDDLEGEARHVGAVHGGLAKRVSSDGLKRAIISGGETTVTVANKNGRGGCNMEYLLSLVIALDGHPGISALACDTDGIDGTEDAAGAIITEDTLPRARALGLDPEAHLKDNNSYVFFEKLGDLVIPGPTLTNVNDFRVILIE